MMRLLFATIVAAGLALSPTTYAKTAKECGAEYSANKASIRAQKMTKGAFIAACKAQAEGVPSLAVQTAGPSPVPAARAPTVQPARTTSAPVTASEAQAQAQCPGSIVVWVNTRSGVYHFRGTHNYGTTKEGSYMCESQAQAAGDRAAKNEKHP